MIREEDKGREDMERDGREGRKEMIKPFLFFLFLFTRDTEGCVMEENLIQKTQSAMCFCLLLFSILSFSFGEVLEERRVYVFYSLPPFLFFDHLI